MSAVVVSILLSGMRWGVVCGVVAGWILGIETVVAIDGAADDLGTAVGYFTVSAIFGTVPGAILGAATGLLIGVASGMGLQMMLSVAGSMRAVFVTFAVTIAVQLGGTLALIFGDRSSVLLLVIPALVAVPLLLTLRRVAREWAEQPVVEDRRDTLAA